MTPDVYHEMLQSLQDGSLSPKGFTHRCHVGMAIAALDRYPFFKALWVVADGLQALSNRAGVPEKFNATITLASMSLIAERRASAPNLTADQMMERFPELLSFQLVQSIFAPDRLKSDVARQVGLLPLAIHDASVEATEWRS